MELMGLMRRAVTSGLWVIACTAVVGCGTKHVVPEQPTWADVEPILRGSCTQCHGAAAAIAGSSYRFDFYDMTSAVCGDAAGPLAGQTLARGWATLIGSDVTPPGSGWRARMPPAPADPLTDWERLTIQRWAQNPLRGEPPRDDRRPDIQLSAASGTADQSLAFSAVVTDPDGESVVGVLNVGQVSLMMGRAGSFGTTLNTASWPKGLYPITATLCDGWDNVTYDLGNVLVDHAPAASDAGTDGPPGDASADMNATDAAAKDAADAAPSDRLLSEAPSDTSSAPHE